eukprot:Lithocolla_globosa_v1_NODE_607_length_3612_cov_5.506888.p2 type:complete len:128 gc:universal NODE_607_length_3612_cov_5.506888:732-349(-)
MAHDVSRRNLMNDKVRTVLLTAMKTSIDALWISKDRYALDQEFMFRYHMNWYQDVFHSFDQGQVHRKAEDDKMQEIHYKMGRLLSSSLYNMWSDWDNNDDVIHQKMSALSCSQLLWQRFSNERLEGS